MPTLASALTDPAAAGIYRLPARLPLATLNGRIAAAGARLARLDGERIADKASLLRAFAAALDFPPYFGRNWDALADCLTDLAWLPPGGQAILYDNPAPLIRHAPADWAMTSGILAEAAERWRASGRPFVVLLRRTAGLVPTIPVLDR